MHFSTLLQEPTPDTSGYMIAGYVVFVVVMAIYLASFLTRKRNLEQDLATLQAIEAEQRTKAPEPPPRRRAAPKARRVKAAGGRRARARSRPSRSR